PREETVQYGREAVDLARAARREATMERAGLDGLELFRQPLELARRAAGDLPREADEHDEQDARAADDRERRVTEHPQPTARAHADLRPRAVRREPADDARGLAVRAHRRPVLGRDGGKRQRGDGGGDVAPPADHAPVARDD